MDKTAPIKQKETAVLLMSDAVISSILYLFAQNSDVPDYDKIIDTVFKQKLESNVLQVCSITLEELYRMKKIFKEEKLYYDFLR